MAMPSIQNCSASIALAAVAILPSCTPIPVGTQEQDPVARKSISSVGPAVDARGSSQIEKQLLSRIRNAPGQERSQVVVDARLARVARARALDMGRRNYFSHTDPDKKGPNYHVAQAGYSLPSHYGTSGKKNTVESIGAGQQNADAAFAAWMKSKGHKRHVLGQIGFYQEQTRVGIGHAYVPDSKFKNYWVFISAPPEG